MRPLDSDPGATELYSNRLDNLNSKFEKLLETLTHRLKTSVEVNGDNGVVSLIFYFFFINFIS